MAIALATPGCHEADSSGGSAAALPDGSGGEDWAGYGRTNGQQHFSPLAGITAANVGTLGLAWSMDLPPVNTVTEPLAIDGVLYFASGVSVVRAVDAASGKLLWEYDPAAGARAGTSLRAFWGVRGVAAWNGRIFVGTPGGELIAVDSRSGRKVWSVQTFARRAPAYLSGAPRVFGGRVLIGFGGTIGAIRGYVTAYDAATGKRLWRFFTVPGDPAKSFETPAMAMAAKTWAGEWWKAGGGGTVWNSMAWDAASDTVYIGTGSPYPWNHHIRSQGKGDNLFANSIVALEGSTGRYKWHYQVVPGDTWDFDATMDIELADLVIGGKLRKVLMQAPKNGFFYVVDRETGELLSAKPYARTTWASHVDMRTGRPVETPGARFPLGSSARIAPSSIGAHNWMPMATDPRTGVVYIPVQDFEANYSELPGPWAPVADGSFGGGQLIVGGPAAGTRKATGALVAWSPTEGRAIWRVAYPTFLNGGVMATGGALVFQGSIDGKLRAFAASSGRIVWQFDAKAPILGVPISYSAHGTQYVTVITGSGTANAAYASSMVGPRLDRYLADPRSQARRVLTFAIGGRAVLPKRPHDAVLADPGYRADPRLAQTGAMPFLLHCSACHGQDAIALSTGPDLRRSTVVQDDAAFAAIVHDGALRSAGMPGFPEFDAAQLAALRQYLRSRAQDLRTGTTASPGGHGNLSTGI